LSSGRESRIDWPDRFSAHQRTQTREALELLNLIALYEPALYDRVAGRWLVPLLKRAPEHHPRRRAARRSRARGAPDGVPRRRDRGAAVASLAAAVA